MSFKAHQILNFFSKSFEQQMKKQAQQMQEEITPHHTYTIISQTCKKLPDLII